jgi:hypothetical protein
MILILKNSLADALEPTVRQYVFCGRIVGRRAHIVGPIVEQQLHSFGVTSSCGIHYTAPFNLSFFEYLLI